MCNIPIRIYNTRASKITAIYSERERERERERVCVSVLPIRIYNARAPKIATFIQRERERERERERDRLLASFTY